MALSLSSLLLLTVFATLFIWAAFLFQRHRDEPGGAPHRTAADEPAVDGGPVLRKTLGLVDQMLVVVDGRRRIVALSAPLAECLDTSDSALVGAPVSTLLDIPVGQTASAQGADVTVRKQIPLKSRGLNGITVSVKETRLPCPNGRWDGALLLLEQDGSLGGRWTPTDTLRARWETLLAAQTTNLEAKNRELEASGRQLQALVDRIGVIKDQEGIRISQVLRDELNGLLSQIRSNVARLKADLGPRFADRTVAVLAVIDSALSHVDRIIDGIRPPKLDRVGLGAAIEAMTANFEKTHSIPCRTRLILAEERIGVDLATAVYKIVQESLTNIARHSGATEAKVALNDGPGGIRLVVEDNGRGIEHGALSEESALGLIGMRERAKAFGGQLEVIPGSNGGTAVRLFVPAYR